MNFKQLVQHFIFQGFVLIVIVFIAFYYKENADLNLVIFGTFLYLPYVFALNVLNFILIALGLTVISKRPYIFLIAILTNTIFVIWFLSSDGLIEIGYWKIRIADFVILNSVILLLNVFTLTCLTRQQK